MAHRHKAKKDERPMPRPFIATPAYDGKFDNDYVISLGETMLMAGLKYKMPVHLGTMQNGAFIDIARNRFVRLFLESNCTHLFFIDGDLKWEPRAFFGLVCSGHPVCAGVYPKRQDPEEYPVHMVPDPEWPADDERIWVKDGWIQCNKVPTGFLCIERSVLEVMASEAPVVRSKTEPDMPYLFYTELREGGSYIGEDFAWSLDYCKRFNTQIQVWPDFTFTHGKNWTGNWHNALMKESALETAKLEAAAKTAAQNDADFSDHVPKQVFEGVA